MVKLLFTAFLLLRLAELMDEHKEELATLESVDSGAVYTLALKTHVGFSIDTFRYFAGWCDKIQGSTIPINNARPSANLCFTKKEPIGYGDVLGVGASGVGPILGGCVQTMLKYWLRGRNKNF